MRIATTLKLLAAGEFICPQRYPDEFEVLETQDGSTAAEEWLHSIGYRLARLHDEGAYFMAHAIASTEVRNQIREEMRTVRTKLQPVVAILETIRQSQGREPRVHAGDMVFVSEVAEEARKSAMLESRIMEMREVSGTRHDESMLVKIGRMMERLRDDGYALLSNETSGGYQITGKVDYLYQLIAYISAHAPHLGDDKLVDQIDQTDAQLRLDTASAAPNAGASDS